jgi:hypothetical protein
MQLVPAESVDALDEQTDSIVSVADDIRSVRDVIAAVDTLLRIDMEAEFLVRMTFVFVRVHVPFFFRVYITFFCVALTANTKLTIRMQLR